MPSRAHPNPRHYLARIVNVELFGFSVTFERVLLGVFPFSFPGGIRAVLAGSAVCFILLYVCCLQMFKTINGDVGTNAASTVIMLHAYYHEVVLNGLKGKEKQ